MYRVRAEIDLPLSIAAGLGIVLPYALSRQLIDPRCPCDAREVNTFDRRAIGNENVPAGIVSDVMVGLALAVPPALDLLDQGWKRPLYEDLLVFAETLAINGALVTAAKYIAQRPLPRTYDGESGLLDKPGGYRSFYSGHTSLVFAALSATSMTIRLRYGERYWPWLGTLLIGTSVAIERVADGRHFPTDVILGAVVGTVIGIGVPWLHDNGLYAAPVASGAMVGWRGTL